MATEQCDLFGEPGLVPAQQAVAAEKREQEQEIRRVHGVLGKYILAFFAFLRDAAEPGQPIQFTLAELQRYVSLRATVAPGSPERILRLLRQDGHLNYRVISRSQSLYEVLDT